MPMNFDIELTSTPITSHAGLAFIGEKLSEAKFERHMETIGPANTRSDRMADADLAKTMVGLICCGKPHYDAVGEYADDPYFPQVLGIEQLPSPEILRQRIGGLTRRGRESVPRIYYPTTREAPRVFGRKDPGKRSLRHPHRRLADG